MIIHLAVLPGEGLTLMSLLMTVLEGVEVCIGDMELLYGVDLLRLLSDGDEVRDQSYDLEKEPDAEESHVDFFGGSVDSVNHPDQNGSEEGENEAIHTEHAFF